jgi:hypothetical protein
MLSRSIDQKLAIEDFEKFLKMGVLGIQDRFLNILHKIFLRVQRLPRQNSFWVAKQSKYWF